MISPSVYPQETHRPTSSHGEGEFYKALKSQLPKTWYAWHSLKIRARNNVLGEGDFVIGIPGKGLIVVEVKAGMIDVRDGRWHQNGKPLTKAPLEQAMEYRGKLLDRLREERVDVGFIEAVVCFPDMHYDFSPPTQDVLRDHIIAGHDLTYLREWLESFASNQFHISYNQTPGWQEMLHKWWGSDWVPALRLATREAKDAEVRYELDQKQFEFFERLMVNPRISVSGPAGSGKTMLALEAARREVKAGRKTLFLCFTNPLAQWIKGLVEPEGVRADTVRMFAGQILVDMNLSDRIHDTPEFWKDVSITAAGEMPDTHLYDTIVIDEAQDFEEQDWLLIDQLVDDSTRVYIFHDPDQRFWAERKLPAFVTQKFVKFPLEKQYRTPEQIWALAECYAASHQGSSMESRLSLIRQGIAEKRIQFVTYQEDKVRDARVKKIIKNMKVQGFQDHDIAIISLAGDKQADLIHQDFLKEMGVVKSDAKDATSSIVADTFLRFKGLERPVIVIGDLEKVSPNRFAIRMHIALTRSTSVIRVLVNESKTEICEIINQLVLS